MLKIEYCRERQKRLLRYMGDSEIDLVVLGNPKVVYYFSGALVDPALPQVFAITASGNSLLVTNREPVQCAADRTERYTGYTIQRVFSRSTMNDEAAGHLRTFAGGNNRAVGMDFEFLNFGLAAALSSAQPVNVTPALDQLLRRKDPDEIECIRKTTALVEAAYAAVKRRLKPGMTELQAYAIISEAIVTAAETSVELRGDFASGVRAINGGGAPTGRRLERGDLYILDLFPIHEGYMCDLCRTFVVGDPAPLQQEAWTHVMEGHRIAQRVIRPGVAGSLVYEEIRRHLDSFAPAKGSFTHHAGHGMGMDGWEFPWLTPGSDHVIQEGEVIACEPGLYSQELRGGIRLEHNYLVGADGLTALDSFPMELK